MWWEGVDARGSRPHEGGFAKIWASQYFDVKMPIFGSNLQVRSSNFGQNTLFAIHLEPYAIPHEATQEVLNPLMDEGHNRGQSKEQCSTTLKNSFIMK